MNHENLGAPYRFVKIISIQSEFKLMTLNRPVPRMEDCINLLTWYKDSLFKQLPGVSRDGMVSERC